MRIAPPSSSIKSIGCVLSAPSEMVTFATRLVGGSPLSNPASSASRFRLPRFAVPLTWSLSGVGVGAFGLRGISGTLSSIIGCSCDVDSAGATTTNWRLTRGCSSSSSTTVMKLDSEIPSSDNFFGKLSSRSGS